MVLTIGYTPRLINWLPKTKLIDLLTCVLPHEIHNSKTHHLGLEVFFYTNLMQMWEPTGKISNTLFLSSHDRMTQGRKLGYKLLFLSMVYH